MSGPKRLSFSANGLVRAFRMSRARVHAFVEGRELDGYVYGRLLAVEFPGAFQYKLQLVQDVPGSAAGGKKELAKLHDFLRRRALLTGDSAQGRYACLFFMDKDIDDVTGRRKRSSHVIYTPTYDLEGHVFRNGDLPHAIAATLFIDPARVDHRRFEASLWTENAMAVWREWVRLCVCAQLLKTRGQCNFGVTSRVNRHAWAPADRGAVARLDRDIQSGSPLPAPRVSSTHRSGCNRVAMRYKAGRAAEVFKGKWFAHLLHDELATLFPAEVARTAGFPSRIVGHLAQGLDYQGRWAQHYTARARALAAAA